jgi:MFS family permease
MGLTQGVLAALVADTAGARLRGSAFGLFALASGVAILVGNLIAGYLWSGYGPRIAFGAGALFAALALTGYLLFIFFAPPLSRRATGEAKEP